MESVERRSELLGLGTIALSIILLLSLVSFSYGQTSANWLGLMGYGLGIALQYTFGLGSFLMIAYVGWWGFRFLVGKLPSRPRVEIAAFGILLLSVCALLTVIGDTFPQVGAFLGRFVYHSEVTHIRASYREIRFHLGGAPFYSLYADLHLRKLLSNVGTTLVFAGTLAGSILVIFDIRLVPLIKEWMKRKPPPPKPVVMGPPPPPLPAPRKKAQPRLQGPYALPKDVGLAERRRVNPSTIKQDLQKQAELLETTLANFGIEAKVGEINYGPTITSFEVHPSTGVKVQKIKALEKDIALNLQAKSIRIIAPIPGKAAVGIEIPNPHPQPVNFKELLSTYQSAGKRLEIPLLLGKTVNGAPLISDLTRMPHLIIAGATGSGKSVCLNAIIMSILMNMRPDEVRLMMIDPKKVELTGYSELPHMIAPVITEAYEAHAALMWMVREMEKRYQLLKQTGVRNITSYNSTKHDKELPKKLSYMVCIVDELADLMMVSSSDIETPITRIAQMARAVGIHLILATQRPSREVITGLIKANFPARIAFKVANRINSQIILDETGAESLIGNGDLLMLPPGTASLVRAQGVYISDQDIAKVVQEITSQAPPDYLIENFHPQMMASGSEGRDSLYNEALAIVKGAGVASTTFLQRKLKIGYARAASIVDQLEENGIIGPQDGSKPRKVLIK